MQYFLAMRKGFKNGHYGLIHWVLGKPEETTTNRRTFIQPVSFHPKHSVHLHQLDASFFLN